MWKTNDPELDKRLRQSFAGDAPKFQRPIEIEVHGLAGKPLTVIARDEIGHVAKVESAMPLAKAEKLPLTEEKLREQLGRLGGTPFKLGELKNYLSGEVLLPVSELNRLRREAVAELERAPRAAETVARSMAADVSPRQAEASGDGNVRRVLTNAATNLIVLVRNPAAARSGVEMRRDDFVLRV